MRAVLLLHESKAALRASLKDSGWMDRLSWVMLGVRTALKDDLQASSAELVYGQSLRVPGEFIPKVTDPWFATQQQETFLKKPGCSNRCPCHSTGFRRRTSHPAEYVFIRQDCHRGTFQPPYVGPFRIPETGYKTCKIDMGRNTCR